MNKKSKSPSSPSSPSTPTAADTSSPAPVVPKLTMKAARDYIATLPDAAEGLRYVCIGAYCWGSGKSAAAAAKRAREEGGAGDFILHLVNAEFEVNTVDGTLYYNSKAPGVRTGMARFRQS